MPVYSILTAKEESKPVEADSKAETVSTQSPENISTDAPPTSEPATQQAPPQNQSQEKTQEQQKDSMNSGMSKQKSVESIPCKITNPVESVLCKPTSQEKTNLSRATQSPSTSAPRHHGTGALMVSKTTYVIPKKQSGPQPQSSQGCPSVPGQKPSSAPSLLNETRNLLVPPAPSAPSSRPPQPNNQVRQSIQRSLTSILLKRVCDCEDLEMSESEVAKLVASIEMEMFDIFRNTDSKYMNKYRTIMFNLKDPKNKGLLFHVVHGEITPFRLVRMSQKDMQAVKASEPSQKATTEVKNKISQPSQGSAAPDVLACMLKDTTSEHKAHLFDLKCKICTGQILAGEDAEPAKKKPKVTETSDKYDNPRRQSAGDDSPLMAPPDSPDMDSPTSSLIDPSSLVIPAVSTVTITRRDPRTAAGRFNPSSSPINTTPNQSAPYAPFKEIKSTLPSAPASSTPPKKKLPKSILMKPTSSADPRLYGTSSRMMTSESPADGETAKFLAKEDIVWKGFLNMLTVAKFVTKAYLVSGPIRRILPETVWDYVAKLKTSVTKELCVIRFHPATEEEEVAYVSLFSYFSSRGRFGVVSNISRSIKDVYLVPLSAKESIPSILQPFEGPEIHRVSG
uniref:Uncharacterized LOC109989164 n=1 Tax=Labrus bergylta TaxID=56723 RepID=A0A3Q3MU17_9LABR